MKEPGRDESIARMLRRTAAARDPLPTGAVCPDAEVLAAWVDEALHGAERSTVEAHVAGCARCQMQLAAMARMAPEAPASVHTHRFRLWPWLVPATAGAAALALWISIEPKPPAAPAAPAPPAPSAPAQKSAHGFEERREPPTAGVKESRQAREGDTAKDRSAASGTASSAARQEVAAQPPAAPPPAAASAAPQALEEKVTTMARMADASPAVTGLAVRRSPEGTVSWDVQPGHISARLTAGASPSPAVIWLVGREGLVLRSTDARTWRQLAFPATVDLTAVQAASETTATVTAVDGRTFATADGGLTWTIPPLQEFPAAPF